MQNDIGGEALYREAVLFYEKAYEFNQEKASDRTTLKQLKKSYYLMHQVLDEHPNSRSADKIISNDVLSITLAKVTAKIQVLQPEFFPQPVQALAARKEEASPFFSINPLIKISSFIEQTQLPSINALKNWLTVKKSKKDEELSPLSTATSLAVNNMPDNNQLSGPDGTPELHQLAEPSPPIKKPKMAVAAFNAILAKPQTLPIKKPAFDSKVAKNKTDDAERSEEQVSNNIGEDERFKLAGNDANESTQQIDEKLIAEKQASERAEDNVTKTEKQSNTSDINGLIAPTQQGFIPFLRIGYLSSLNTDAQWFDKCDTSCSDQWVSAGSSEIPSYQGQSIQIGLLRHPYYLSLGFEKQNNQVHILRDVLQRNGGRSSVLEYHFNTSITLLEIGKEWPIKNTNGLAITYLASGKARRKFTKLYGNDSSGPYEGFGNIKSSQNMWRAGSGYAFPINENWRVDGRLQYSDYGRVVLSNQGGGRATGRKFKAIEANVGLTYTLK